MEKGFTINPATKSTVIDMAECLLTPGEINLSWNDIRTILHQDGDTVIAFGSGNGKSRAIAACVDALSNHRTASQTTKKPTRLLFRLIGPRNLLLKEVNDAREIIEELVCPTSGVVFGVARDDNLNDEVRITIITT